jgi:hypothetical protein
MFGKDPRDDLLTVNRPIRDGDDSLKTFGKEPREYLAESH